MLKLFAHYFLNVENILKVNFIGFLLIKFVYFCLICFHLQHCFKSIYTFKIARFVWYCLTLLVCKILYSFFFNFCTYSKIYFFQNLNLVFLEFKIRVADFNIGIFDFLNYFFDIKLNQCIYFCILFIHLNLWNFLGQNFIIPSYDFILCFEILMKCQIIIIKSFNVCNYKVF